MLKGREVRLYPIRPSCDGLRGVIKLKRLIDAGDVLIPRKLNIAKLVVLTWEV